MPNFVTAVLLVVVGVYAAFTLPTGHIDPCRALFARALDAAPRPTFTDAASIAMGARAEAAMFNLVAQAGPVRCFQGLVQDTFGMPVTTIR